MTFKYSGQEVQDNLNPKARILAKVLTEGFWRETPEQEIKSRLPFPVAYEVKGYNKQAFIVALDKKEGNVQIHSRSKQAVHRWTKRPNGSLEYVSDMNWRWPQGYMEYIKAGVPPSRQFYAYIMNKDLETLPDYHEQFMIPRGKE